MQVQRRQAHKIVYPTPFERGGEYPSLLFVSFTFSAINRLVTQHPYADTTHLWWVTGDACIPAAQSVDHVSTDIVNYVPTDHSVSVGG